MSAARVAVTGGRDFFDAVRVYTALDRVHAQGAGIVYLIHGAADGADWLARCWALFRGVEPMAFKADWRTYGPAAGPIRNRRMLKEGFAELLVAFPGHKGTANCIEEARQLGIEVIQA